MGGGHLAHVLSDQITLLPAELSPPTPASPYRALGRTEEAGPLPFLLLLPKSGLTTWGQSTQGPQPLRTMNHMSNHLGAVPPFFRKFVQESSQIFMGGGGEEWSKTHSAGRDTERQGERGRCVCTHGGEDPRPHAGNPCFALVFPAVGTVAGIAGKTWRAAVEERPWGLTGPQSPLPPVPSSEPGAARPRLSCSPVWPEADHRAHLHLLHRYCLSFLFPVGSCAGSPGEPVLV